MKAQVAATEPGAKARAVRVAELRAAPGDLRFRVESSQGSFDAAYAIDPPIEPSPDAILPATLLPAMALGDRLELGEPVDGELLAKVGEIQAVLLALGEGWPNPEGPLNEVEVDAVAVERALPGGRGVGAFFSGGVDSFATVLSRPEITDLVFLSGFDFAVGAPTARRALDAARDVAASLGKRLIAVETNVRRLGDRTVAWQGYFGSLLASVAHLLSPVLERVLIAGDSPYRQLLSRGSHPMLDHLWGGGALTVVHDGARHTRAEKVEMIAGDRLAQRTLRVCWQDLDDAYNCGRCEKCLRTMASLAALGVLERFETFPQPIDPVAMATVVPRLPVEVDYWRETLALARAYDAPPALHRAIEAVIANGELARAGSGAEAAADPAAIELEAVHAELARITDSASWRLTAPLRAAKARVVTLRRRWGPR